MSESNLKITVALRAAAKPGSIKGHADVTVDTGSSKIEIFGLSIVQHDPAKQPWCSYPQRAGKNGKKYFAIVRVSGMLHEKICAAVLREFERSAASASEHGAVPRAQIPREPGDDSIQF